MAIMFVVETESGCGWQKKERELALSTEGFFAIRQISRSGQSEESTSFGEERCSWQV